MGRVRPPVAFVCTVGGCPWHVLCFPVAPFRHVLGEVWYGRTVSRHGRFWFLHRAARCAAKLFEMHLINIHDPSDLKEAPCPEMEA